MSGITFELNTPRGRMMATMLTGIAHCEHDLLSKRVKSGLAAAEARGKKLGRQPSAQPKPNQLVPNVIKAVEDDRSFRWIARDLAISKNTVSDIVKRSKIPGSPKSTIRKVCPVVLRKNDRNLELLAFKHPKAGNQFVKGTIENCEADQAAAKRELFEESGINANAEFIPIGSSHNIVPNQEWTFFQITLTDLPDLWSFQTKDDGGHEFSFFWIPLDKKLTSGWHEIFVRAHEFINGHIQTV